MLPEFTVQWYPGHMAKAKRAMQESLNLVDLIIEVRDARAPLASSNPNLDIIGKDKERLILLNKADLAEERVTRMWQLLYPEMLIFSSKSVKHKKRLQEELNKTAQKIKADWLAKNKGLRPFRALVLGMPNVGKSTLINTLATTAKAKTGQKPGVTRAKQWLTLPNNWQLLDTPGIMMPEEVKGQTALCLALINCLDEKLYDPELAALHFIVWLQKNYPQALLSRYKLEFVNHSEPRVVLEEIGKKRGAVLSGGVVDTNKAAYTLLKDFRQGFLGSISLEKPLVSEEYTL